MHVLLTNTSVGPKAVLFIKGIATVAGKQEYSHKVVSIKNIFVVFIQSLSCVKLFATPWTETCQASLSFSSSWSFLKHVFMSR